MVEKKMDHDPENMRKRIEALPDQFREAAALSDNVKLSEQIMHGNFSNAVLCGMGGSAISGDIVSAYLSSDISIPFSVVRNYHLPSWVNERTLLYPVSYSGNTEETISCLEEGIRRGAGIIGVSSGGRVMDICRENDLDHVRIPPGWPPRTAVGYLVTPVLRSLELLGLSGQTTGAITKEIVPLLENVRNSFLSEGLKKKNELTGIAGHLEKRMLMVYAPPELGTAARRWMCQVNENSKVLGHWGEIPEMNHNELVGWGGDSLVNDYLAVFLVHDTIEPRILKRIEITSGLIEKRDVPSIILKVPGESAGAALMAAIYMGDILSLKLARLRKIDPTPVKMIDHLKGCLADGE